MGNQIEFTKEYIEACFRAWYAAGSPGVKTQDGKFTVGGTRIIDSMPPDENGRKPNSTTLSKWIDNYGWRERADALDAEVSIQLDRESIQARIETLRTLAQNGKTLKEKGLKFINDTDDPFFDNPSAAVRAIVAGSEMEFKYAGAADRLAAITQMSDKQIEQQIMKLLKKESRQEQNENEEIVESTLEDIDEDSNANNDDS